eukprot:8776985-Pyramimonas_sp.AAC.1
MARWPDGWTHELDTLTVSAWRGAQKEKKQHANVIWQKTSGENKYCSELKLLDRDNPGVVVKVNGKQKGQLAFKYVKRDVAVDQATTWAKEMAAKKISEDAAK